MSNFIEIVPVESSLYPKTSFTGVLLDHVIQERNDKLWLSLEFENPEDPDHPLVVSVLGLDYLDEIVNDSYEAKDSFDMGKLIKSLNVLGVKLMIDLDDELIQTVPDIRGATCSMNANLKKTVTEDGEKEYPHWTVDVIKGVGGLSKPSRTTETSKLPDPSSNETSSNSNNNSGSDKPSSDSLKSQWVDLLVEITADNPVSEVGIQGALVKRVSDRKLRKELNDVRKTVLTELVSSGDLSLDENNKYQIA